MRKHSFLKGVFKASYCARGAKRKERLHSLPAPKAEGGGGREKKRGAVNGGDKEGMQGSVQARRQLHSKGSRRAAREQRMGRMPCGREGSPSSWTM